MKVFLDSSALFAWADASSRAGGAIETYVRTHQPQLILTNLIFAETISLITKRIGKPQGISLGRKILQSQIMTMVTIDEQLHQEAWNLYAKYKDKDFDLIDATSFVVCTQQDISHVLTLDRHFTQMGYQMYPAESESR